jgi:hypothetical protein
MVRAYLPPATDVVNANIIWLKARCCENSSIVVGSMSAMSFQGSYMNESDCQMLDKDKN